MADESKTPPTTSTAPEVPITELPIGGGIVLPGRGDAVAAPLPSGGISLGVDTTVADALKNAEPTFGNVLRVVGDAVTNTQNELDKAVVKSIAKLNDITIDLITQVEIELDENGIPFGDAQHTNLVKTKVSLAQFYTPRPPIVKRVDTSLDLIVGGFHSSQGVQFSAKQSNTSIGGGVSWSKSFSGWFSASHSEATQNVQASTQIDAEFVSGQLLIDAEFGTRSLTTPPAAVQTTVGPQMLIVQGNITEVKTNNVVTSRAVNVDLVARKKSGDVNPQVSIVLEAPGLLGGGGKVTDAAGKITYQLTRDLPAGTTGFRQFPLTFILGDLRSPYALTL